MLSDHTAVEPHPFQTLESPIGSPAVSGAGGLLERTRERALSHRSLAESSLSSSFGIEERTPHHHASNRRDSQVSVSASYQGQNSPRRIDSHYSSQVCVEDFDWWGLCSKSEWKKIGKGGYGTVYKTKWYGTTVAIKESTPGKSSAMRALRKEVNYLTRCSHPNVVKVFGHFENNGSLYVVMEYLPYCFRDEWVASRADILEIVVQVARAMFYLHRKGIIHRDIKTRNICLTADYKIAKVIDFGLVASMYSSSEELTRRVGTRKYRAPEVNHPNVQGFGVDVFSYGAMIKRLLKDINQDLIKCSNATSLQTVLAPLAGMCVNQNPCSRPTSLEILQYLHQCTHSMMPVKEIFATTINEDLKESCIGLCPSYQPMGKLITSMGDEDLLDDTNEGSGKGKRRNYHDSSKDELQFI